MANVLSFVVDSITADRATGVLVDETTYSSPARAATALYVKGQKMNANASVASTLTITPDESDPETDSEYTFNIPADGWLRFLIVSIPDFDSGETYAQYDAVFDSGVVYRSKLAGNTEDDLSNTTWWEVISDPATLASNVGEVNESTNIDSLIYEPGVFPNSEYGFANEIAEASEEYLTSLNLPDENLVTYDLLSLLLNGAYVHSDRNEMNRSERVARKIEAILESL